MFPVFREKTGNIVFLCVMTETIKRLVERANAETKKRDFLGGASQIV